MAKYNAFELRKMMLQGQAMKNPAGDPSYPIADEEDLSNAIHAVGRGGASANAIRKYIMGRAKAMGKSSMIPDTWNADGSLSADGVTASSSNRTPATHYTRSLDLEDINIRAGGDGRTVEAFAAAFNKPYGPIHDADGEYMEELDPTCFNRAISDAAPSGGRQNWKVGVFYNHGMHPLFSTPSDLGSVPIGVPLEIRAEPRGLYTLTRYNPSAENILENIRSGAITSYSFSGAFRRSDPQVPHGRGFRRDSRGNVPSVRRMESTLREYGPTPFPANQDAAIVGVRAEQAAMLLAGLAPDEREHLVDILRAGAPLDSLDDTGAPDMGLATEDSHRQPAEMRSGRSPRQIAQAQRAAFIIRHGGH